MAHPVLSDGTFAGYRLLRTLGVGSRSDVYLAAGSSGSVALKVFADGVDHDSVGIELEALGRLDSPHLVRLRDLTDSGNEFPALVLERVRRGSVAALLRDRDSLERGEVVTLLAPLARLVTELQLAGVAHGKIGAASVHLGDGGEPVLIGLGHATLFAAAAFPAALDAEPSAAADRDALAAFAVALLGRVRDAGRDPRAAELTQWIGAAPAVFEFPAALEERLFDWAEAMPIAFSRGGEAAPVVPGRIGVPGVVEARPEPQLSSPARVERVRPHWLPNELLENPFGELRRRAGDLARGVRRPYWIVAALVGVGLVLALALIPAGNSSPTRVPPGTVAPRPLPTPSALPNDPLLALPLLLKSRETCFRNLSVLCLDDIDEASSAAFAADASAIQQIQEGGEIPKSVHIQAPSIALIERLGDSALFSLGSPSTGESGSPASVLMIRSESGWRIRDFLTGAQATPGT
jgi:eukaryotic-like serine/threonine-protein kinase